MTPIQIQTLYDLRDACTIAVETGELAGVRELYRELGPEPGTKIVQIVIGPDNSTYQGHLFGLGSDGAVYAQMPEGWAQVTAPL